MISMNQQTYGGYPVRFSINRSIPDHSIAVRSYGFSLSLKPLGIVKPGGDGEKALTPEGAAEYYWGLFVEQLQ